MSQKEFDDIIKNKLSSFSSSQPKGDWSSFEKKMEADDHFDELVKNKLQSFEVPFDPKSWKPLARRIESEFGWLNKVFRFKLVEFSFLLLVTYFLNQVPVQIDQSSPINTIVENNFSSELYPTKENPKALLAENAKMELGKFKKIAPFPSTVKKVEFESVKEDITAVKESTPDQLNAKKVLEIESNQPIITFSSGAPNIVVNHNTVEKFNRYVALNFFYGADVNRIVTPFDSENRFDRLDRYAKGYSIGLTVDIYQPKYILQTGFIISNKHYSPRQVIYYAGSVKNGFFGKQLEDIELNILTLPLSLKRELLTLKAWRVSALAGIAWNVALDAGYQIQLKSSSGFNNYKSANLDNLVGSIRGKQLNQGWLEGGGFMENSYMSFDLGLSFERPIGNRLNWFVQPTYRHTNRKLGKGLGPDQDIINTFSLYSGITFRFGR